MSGGRGGSNRTIKCRLHYLGFGTRAPGFFFSQPAKRNTEREEELSGVLLWIQNRASVGFPGGKRRGAVERKRGRRRGLPCTWKRESCTPQPHAAALAHLWGAPHTRLGPLKGPSLKNWPEQQHFLAQGPAWFSGEMDSMSGWAL